MVWIDFKTIFILFSQWPPNTQQEPIYALPKTGDRLDPVRNHSDWNQICWSICPLLKYMYTDLKFILFGKIFF